ncbi:MAG: septum formation initiator family protein [Tannerella sp.]|jgi:cell division protein FtsB|nr:septum formation initiator family protein [Tannerella sp.]
MFHLKVKINLKEYYRKYRSGWMKYKYGLVIGFFAFITFVVGDSNLLRRYSYDEKIRDLEKEIRYYRKEVEASRKKINDLRFNKEWLEQYAREEYFMKKENEDVFIIADK